MQSKILTAIVVASLSTASWADHSWNNYHWARTTNSFDLTIINSTTPDWDSFVSAAVADWSSSNSLNMIEDFSSDSSRKTRRQCRGGAGTVRICNLDYGNTGWLGIAGISLDTNGHISTGYTKLNDTYFDNAYYNTLDWKLSVTCQELGHNIGLGHQDEDFNNTSLKSCMDYQDPPWPDANNHDFEQIATQYGHTDSYDSYVSSGGGGGGGGDGGDGGCNSPPGKGCNKADVGNNAEIGWGASIGRRGNQETFIRIDHDGTMHITFVTWVPGHGGDHH